MSTNVLVNERQSRQLLVRLATWAHRAATGLLILLMAASGVANLARPEPVVTMLRHLGYPDYFPLIIGIAKLLAAVALALPGARRLKEWAYAGITFDFLGALASHAAIHGTLTEFVAVFVGLVLLSVSYAGHRRRTVMIDLGKPGGTP